MLRQITEECLLEGGDRQARRKATRRAKEIDSQTKTLLQDRSLATLSLLLSNRTKESENTGSFSGKDIVACLEGFLGTKVSEAMLHHFSVQLVKIGFLEPESPEQRLIREGVASSREELASLVKELDVEEVADLLLECIGRDRMSTLRFFPTILFEEMLEEAKEEERDARIKALGGQIGKLTRDQQPAERRCEELSAGLRRAEERLGGIREELVATEQEIERLKGSD
jgi:hypothetical protein